MRRILSGFRFSSAAHDTHAVSLNLSQNWVSNPNGKFMSVTGFVDQNDHPHHDDSNPYQHIVDAPFFSFERWYFVDGWYTKDQDEPLMNTPHGYLFMDDPLSDKNNIDVPSYELIFLMTAAFGIAVVFGVSGLKHASASEVVFQQHITRGLIEDEIRRIRIENAALELRRDELKSQL